MVDVKGAAYFLDASQVGICEISENVWLNGIETPSHSHAVVIVQSYTKNPETSNLAHPWCDGLDGPTAEFRSYELAFAVTEYIRILGYHAKAHDRDTGDVDIERLAILAGVALRNDDGITNPYLDKKFAVTVVTTDYALAIDQPLHSSAKRAKGLAYYHANMMPPPNQPEPVTVNRKEALAAGALLETPNEIITRLDEGGETPAHYRPTKPIGHEDFKRMKTDEGLNPSKSS
jgi:hypothetical protein